MMNVLKNAVAGLIWCAIPIVPFMLYVWGYGM